MKSARLTRYSERMGRLPKRRWDFVTPPDFFVSYSKYAWTYWSVWSPMILMEFLLAPTVPSEPNPQNLQLTVSGSPQAISPQTGRERCVTSSSIPTVKWFIGSGFFRFSYTAAICAGVTSLEERP